MATNTQTEVVMPQMGVSVAEGTITKWLKAEGDPIAQDEALLEISTDKVDTEVPSPGAGVVAQIVVQEGETVDVGTVLAVIAPAGSEPAGSEAGSEVGGADVGTVTQDEMPPPPATQAAADEAMAAASEGVGDVSQAAEPAQQAPAAPAETPPAPAAAPAGGGDNGRTFLSPVVARIASEHGVDVSQVQGTGTGGRVTKKDILAFVESGASIRATPPPAEEATPQQVSATPPAAPSEVATPVAPQPPPPAAPQAPAQAVSTPQAAPRPQPQAVAGEPAQGEAVEPMTAMRRGIAEHMRRSLDTSAHVTSAIEVDMSKVVAIRGKLKQEYGTAYGVNPTYLSFVARATVETLRDFPWINGEIRGDKIVTRNYVNLGFAVELADGKGLIVPVVKNTEGLNLLGMARAVTEIAARARDKKLTPDDVQGGTFTITNPGGYGTFHGTPVISQPQAGILGTYAVVKRPWVVQDELGQDVIAVRPIMNLTLTYDHRLVDGALAGRFLRDLRKRLESWGESDY